MLRPASAPTRSIDTLSQRAVPAFLRGGGEAGALVRATDWANTTLGAPDTWSPTLRTMVAMVLHNHSPMLLWWGPQFVQIYNDAYQPVLGEKHPRGMGVPVAACWDEIIHIIGPMIEVPYRGGPASTSDDLAVLLNRRDFAEEAHFKVAYSPVPDPTAPNGVGGVLATVEETTEKVYGERQLRTLRELAVGAAEVKTADEACIQAAKKLQDNGKDVPFALFYLFEPDGVRARLAAQVGFAQSAPAAPQSIDFSSGPWPLKNPAAQQLFHGLRKRLGHLPCGGWDVSPDDAMALPLASPDQAQSYGVLICGLSPHRALDETYASFLELAGTQVITAIRNARAYETERQRAEALAEIDRSKTIFFSNVSHEFRTPLTLMLAPLEDNLAASAGLSPVQLEREQLAYRNALRLLRLVNSLLDFSRIEAGRMVAVYQPTNLAQFTAELASSFRSAMEKAELAFDVDADVRDAVFVDREMWEKIVLNLISNAFKFTLHGSVHVSLHQLSDCVRLQVRDTGTGIPPAELPRVFERVHRVEGSPGRTHEGTGIGLALIQELVRLHSGTARVASTLGQGSTFTVDIPLGKTHLPADQVRDASTVDATSNLSCIFVEEALRWLPDESGAAPVADRSSAAPPNATRILLADDNADMRRYVHRLLSTTWQVVSVPDGAAALEYIKAHPVDLVLSDVMMPKVNGFQLVAALKGNPETRAIPVILLSARAGEEATVEGLQAGADDYLVKPFSAKELHARVHAQIKINQLRKDALVLQNETEKARQDLFEFFMQSPAAMVVLLGPEHRFLLANPPYGRLVGDRALKGRSVAEVFSHDEVGHFVRQLDRVYQTGEPFAGHELPLFLADSAGHVARKFVSVGYHPFRELDGTIKGILAVHQDVTEQVMSRKKVEKLAADLQVSLQSRDEFLCIASHELKTPITSLKLQLQMAKRRIRPECNRQLTPEALNGLLDTSLRQVDRLTELVEDLLDVSRIQAGKLLFDFQQVTADHLVREVVDRFDDQLKLANCSMDVDVPPQLSAVWDRSRVEQILVNLISNAIKYAPGKGIAVRVRSHQDRATIMVEDHGVGIPKDRQEKIFERFERATSCRSISGLGLGLYIVKQIVQGHHGSIRVNSREGQGTTFIVELPLHPPAASAAPAP